MTAGQGAKRGHRELIVSADVPNAVRHSLSKMSEPRMAVVSIGSMLISADTQDATASPCRRRPSRSLYSHSELAMTLDLVGLAAVIVAIGTMLNSVLGFVTTTLARKASAERANQLAVLLDQNEVLATVNQNTDGALSAAIEAKEEAQKLARVMTREVERVHENPESPTPIGPSSAGTPVTINAGGEATSEVGPAPPPPEERKP